jgi:hypothetical protein
MVSSTLQPECVEGLLSYARLFFAQPHSGKVQARGAGYGLVVSTSFFLSFCAGARFCFLYGPTFRAVCVWEC